MSRSIELDYGFTQDPTDLYRRLRTEAPVAPVLTRGGVRGWLVTRYSDAVALLHDPRLSKDYARSLDLFSPDQVKPYESPLYRNMLGSDAPKHTRLRKLVVKAFNARAVETMRLRIEEIAEDLLDDITFRSEDPVDLISAYAAPLPIRVISEMLGIAKEDSHAFRSAATPLVSSASHARKRYAEEVITDIIEDTIAAKRRKPGEDLLTHLLNVSDGSDQLNHEELLATVFLLISAGYETTVNLIGNGVLALLDNPAQMLAVRQDPDLLDAAIEEVLRYDSPVNIATTRFTTEPVKVDDVTIPPNEIVLISLLSANHDDTQYSDADHFDVSRKRSGHLAFGHGAHYCVGAALARLEGATAIGRLLARFRTIERVGSTTLTYQDSTLMRGVLSLPVRVR